MTQTALNDLLQLSPPLLLALALNLIGYALRASPIPNWTIPFLLMSAGGVAGPYILADGDALLAERVLRGVVLGGFAVGLNQAWRQLTQGRGDAPTGNATKSPPPTPPTQPPGPVPPP
jgi:hypothetical protein